MAHLVLTLVGDDRAGLVNALADSIASHGGNWERSELAELGGAFAGVVLVSVPEERAADLVRSLEQLDGMLRITVHGAAADAPPMDAGRALEVTVLGNDRPGIVRDVTAAIRRHALSIDGMRTRTLDAPMSGGILFEAHVTVRVPREGDPTGLREELERLAGEIQVDVTVA